MSDAPIKAHQPSGDEPNPSRAANHWLTIATVVIAVVLLVAGLRMIWAVARH
jgi:hypothetical protein